MQVYQLDQFINIMKNNNYNKILEAVNKGIQLALDDFEDIENNSISGDIISTKDVIADRVEIDKLTVDLGLPSGTRWCKYNIGVNPKFLNTTNNYYGNYYAWGEIFSRKRIYSWDNYKFAKAQYNTITKYTTNGDYLNYDKVNPDNLTVLQPEDDIATIKLGKHFHIPTEEDFKELRENTIASYEKNWGAIGLNGILYTSKINGNYIFFPCAGYKNAEKRGDEEIVSRGELGRYWTANLFKHDNRNAIVYTVSKNGLISSIARRLGCSIRPVYK